MKTETQETPEFTPIVGEEEPYWHRAIRQAKARGGFLLQDVNKAASWCTCACGSMDDRIPREVSLSISGAPKDNELKCLGVDFLTAVSLGCPALEPNQDNLGFVRDAERILWKIEARSAEILQELEQ